MQVFMRSFARFTHTMFRAFFIVALVATASVALSGSSRAANGDQLRQITGDRGSAGGCSINTGIAFDGTNLLLSCWYDNKIVAVSPADGHFVTSHAITGVNGMGAIAYDGVGHVLWVCSLHSDVGRVNLATNTYTKAFTSAGCTDGLAYDGKDGTIWTSADAAYTTQHYTSAGVQINSYSNSGLLGNCGNSGIAVGGDLLYLANNGCSEIYRVAKDFSSSTLFATFSRRLEDLECDDLTFASQGKAAIWSIDAYDTILNAWEIPAGSCNFGGGVTTAQPTPEPTRPQVTATSPSCGLAVITATGVTPGLPHQIVVTPSAGGTPIIANIATDASQKVTATIPTGGGTFDVFVRMTSNQVTVTNTVILKVAACAVATPTPTPTPKPATPTPAPTPTPTPAPIAQLPSTGTGGDNGTPIAALAAIALALAAFALRKRDSRT